MSVNNQDEARDAAFKVHYTKAIDVVENNGYYWFSAPRPMAYALESFIQEYGIEIFMHSYPPDFDFVIYKQHLHNREKLQKLARIRFDLKEQGIDNDALPTAPID
ncbi:hypothetical protein ACUN40_002543 [Proteus mirabilis]